jgi:hypothetical protein
MRYLKPILACIFIFTITASAADVARPVSFAWLSGHWCSLADGELIEEYWLPPAGTLSLGLGRTIKAGKTTSFEFMRIETDADAPVYVAQPQGRPPTRFALADSGADWVRFENPLHDFPRRVEYRRTERGLHAEIAGPGADGKQLVIPFDYRRCVD